MVLSSSIQFEIDASHYYNAKGKQEIDDPTILKNDILNIYKMMLSGRINGTYIYVCNEELKDYLDLAFMLELEDDPKKSQAIVEEKLMDAVKTLAKDDSALMKSLGEAVNYAISIFTSRNYPIEHS